MKHICLFVMLLMTGQAEAQTLYICATSAGHSYQQTPCAPAARLIRTIDTQPDQPPTVEQRRQRAEKALEDRAESAFLSHMAGTDGNHVNNRSVFASRSNRAQSPRRQVFDACRAARAARVSTRRALGFDRTFETLRTLDVAVADACNEQRG